jgi:flagellar assembly protein FliH
MQREIKDFSKVSGSLLSKEEAEVQAVAYMPRKFPVTISAIASDFAHNQHRKEGTSFRLDDLVARQTGISEIERMSIEEKVEREALVRLKEMQEQAYQQSYQLGLDDGREAAFQQYQNEFRDRITSLDDLLASIFNLKSDLISFNESHIVHLIFYIARRIAMDEVSARPELILQVVRQAIENAQTEESFLVRVAAGDLQFIEAVKDKLGKDMDSLRRAKFEASDEVASGGCVVTTNYGDVDARIETRINKIWTSLSEKLPKVKDEIGSES